MYILHIDLNVSPLREGAGHHVNTCLTASDHLRSAHKENVKSSMLRQEVAFHMFTFYVFSVTRWLWARCFSRLSINMFFANEELCFLWREQMRSLLPLFSLFKVWFSLLDSKQSSVCDAVGLERVPFTYNLYLCIHIFCPNSRFLFIPVSVVTWYNPIFASFSALFAQAYSHILLGSVGQKCGARIKKKKKKSTRKEIHHKLYISFVVKHYYIIRKNTLF